MTEKEKEFLDLTCGWLEGYGLIKETRKRDFDIYFEAVQLKKRKKVDDIFEELAGQYYTSADNIRRVYYRIKRELGEKRRKEEGG